MKAQFPCGRKNPVQKQATSQPKNWKVVLDQFLKEKGLRSTTQREKIAEIALAQKDHFEIQTLIREVQLVYSDISPATVYRSVATLCEAGILDQTLQNTTGVTLYEATDHAHHHDHVVCLDCGEIYEFHDEGLEAAQRSAIRKLNFEESRHQHVIYAHCSLLSKKK